MTFCPPLSYTESKHRTTLWNSIGCGLCSTEWYAQFGPAGYSNQGEVLFIDVRIWEVPQRLQQHESLYR